MSSLSRRDFLAAGGALYVTFKLGAETAIAQTRPEAVLPRAMTAHPGVGSWLRIGTDDTVTVFTGKVEFGQGLKTALVQLAAEELDVRPEKVHVISADTRRTPNEAYTAGSRSIQDSGMSVRYAAAEARRILLELAGKRLGVPVDSLQVSEGRIASLNGESLRFGELVEGQTFDRPVDGTAPLKLRKDYKLVGRSLPRVDFPAKVFGGTPAFIQDLRLENMLHARMVHPPTQKARLKDIDTAAAKSMPGVQLVLHDGSLLGVVATREEQAIAAAERLAQQARWTNAATDDLPDDDSLQRYMRGLKVSHAVVAERGELGKHQRRNSATYLRPFQAHASIGPSCSVAVLRDGVLTVWSHTQGIYPLRAEIARVLGMPEAAIHAISMENAGCYGQNGADDAAIEAAMLARAMPGKPVRLQWSRADEFGWEPLGAAMLIDCEAALNADGRIVEWRSVVRGFPNTARPGFGAGPGANLLAAQLRKDSMPTREMTNVGLNRNSEPLYDIPALRVAEELIPQSPVRVSSLRTLGAYANVFALESFMDELAVSAGADPVAFRLAHLRDERGRAVIEAAAAAANWKNRHELPQGRGLGIGYARYSNSSTYCAIVADVTVAESGNVRVHKLWAAADCGPIVNPNGVRNQIGGGAIQATSWTLLESVRIRNGDRAIANWSDYPILRITDAPEVEVILIDRPEEALVGTGEASLGPAGAAIANAVYAAAGARIRQIPLTPQRVLASVNAQRGNA